MDWSYLGSLFCLELCFGAFAFLTLLSYAPVSPFFFRMNGVLAILLLLLGWWVHFWKLPHQGFAFDLVAFGSLLALAGFVVSLWPIRSQLRRILLALATAGSAVAVFGAIGLHHDLVWSDWALFALSAGASGLIVGGVGIAMAFGHCYLTVPNMEISYLSRLNGVTMLAMGLKLLCLATILFLFAAQLSQEENDLFRPTGYFHLGTRLLMGILLPFVFGVMVWGCLKHKSTRSATGILYASTVLVMLGEAIGVSLWSSYGVPL